MTEAYKMDDRPIAEIERETLANLRAAEFVERKSGRFGPYVQLGEGKEAKRASTSNRAHSMWAARASTRAPWHC